MAYFTDNKIINDNSGRSTTNWSTKRNNYERLRHRPHISNTSNSRGEGIVKYYSSLDADILFGGVFIDEVTNLNFSIQQNTMPIFGYNSYTFDDIAVGSRLVQGQFAINFTEANYLSRVQSVMTAVSRQMYGDDVPNTSNFSDTDRKIRNTPIWDKGFDIVIGYGERNKSSASEYEQVMILSCCQLTGCSQQLDYNGEPILEAYTFIARDIKYVTKQQYDIIYGDLSTQVEQEEPLVSFLIDVDINLTEDTGKILVENNSDIYFDSGSIIVMGVDETVFNTEIELKATNQSMMAKLTAEQKNAISKYCNEQEMNKVTTQLKFTGTKNGESVKQDTVTVAKITI